MKKFIVALILSFPSITQSQVICDNLLEKQLQAESGNSHYKINDLGNRVVITSDVGARGVAQFMPGTWEWMKDTNKIPSYFDINNETHQRKAHKIYMRYLYNVNYGINDNIDDLVLASYNAGVNRVKRLVTTYNDAWRNYLPEETKKYIKNINKKSYD
jgi:soluble lytic murein transglycosylase-like protein